MAGSTTRKRAKPATSGDKMRSATSDALYAALEQRTANVERAVQSFELKMDKIAADLGDRLDKQAAKPTNWFQFYSAAAAIIGVLGGFGFYVKSEIDGSLARLDRGYDHIEATMLPTAAFNLQHVNDLQRMDAIEKSLWTRDAQTEFAKRVDEINLLQHEYLVRDEERLTKRVDEIDANLIKRPELTTMFSTESDRMDDLRERVTDLLKTVEAMSPSIGDIIKELQANMREIRQTTPPAIVAPSHDDPTGH